MSKEKFDKVILTQQFSLQKKLDDNRIDEIVEKQLMFNKMYDLCNYIIEVNQNKSQTANNFINIEIRVRY